MSRSTAIERRIPYVAENPAISVGSRIAYRDLTSGTVSKICDGCVTPFQVERRELMRGNGKFCSRICARTHMPRRPVAERFWEKVDRNGPVPVARPELGPCWLWTARLTNGGYGRFTLNTDTQVLAHRMAWELVNGPIADGLEVDHLCFVTKCVNPSHLEPVTPAVNRERSTAPPVINAQKTHCINGHAFTPENTRYRTDRPGSRECLACERSRCRI